MSDEGVTGGDIYLVPATGGKARNLTPALEGSASWLAWHPSSRSILFAEHRRRRQRPRPGWTWTAA